MYACVCGRVRVEYAVDCVCTSVCVCLICDVAAGEAPVYRFVVECSIEHRRAAGRLCSPG